MLVLAVERDQPRTELAQVGCGGRPPLHEGPRAPIGPDAAAEDDLVGVVGQALPQLGQIRIVEQARRRLEDTLDVGLGRTRPHDSRARLASQQEVERVREHGLAGTGLTGQRIEPGTEPELGPFDQEQVLDAKLYEHTFGCTGRSRRNAGLPPPQEASRPNFCVSWS